MAETNEAKMITRENVQQEELQTVLMKMVAEQNREKFLEYDCKTDQAVLSTIENGHYKEIERIEGYYAINNLSISNVAEEDRELYRKEVERCLKRPMSRVIELRYLNAKGEKIWHRVYLVSIADEQRKVVKLAGRFISVQKEKEAQEMLRTQAERDSLSGVYNRETYEKKCQEMIEKQGEHLLFLTIDIDDFKRINDLHGHHIGDSIVNQVGEVLGTLVKEHGIAGRVGGDEFSACLYNVDDKETAVSLCIRLKEGIKQAGMGIPFTVSIGAALTAGRQMTFSELCFEADRAVFYSKEHGKNLIVFTDEIEENTQEEFEEQENEYLLSDEDFSLDQRVEYCVVTHPINKKVLYMNDPARTTLGISLEEARKLHCYELFKGKENPCGVCELHGNHVDILEGEDACGLAKYIPEGKFIIQSQYCVWKGESARLTTFLNVNEPEHLTRCLEDQVEFQNTLEKCWNLILGAGLQDFEYEEVLQEINRYYDADCCTIVTKNDNGKYDRVFEYHKDSANNVAEGLMLSLERDAFEKCEVLLDEEGLMRPRHIQEKLKEYPDIAKTIREGFVHDTIGCALSRQGNMAGVLMVLNPKHHKADYGILKRVGVFFTTDLLRKRLSDVKDYESNHDTLTRLWNRDYFMPFIGYFSHRLQKNYGIFMADIFRLGEINKNFGYETGNQRLIELADLHRKVFEAFAIFRYDDDQILTICHATEKEEFEKIVGYAKELIAELDFEVSCGYSWTVDGDIAEVIREAESYLDRDRQRLEKENDIAGKTAKRVEKDVLEQIEKGNFRMFLQPKVSAKTGKTVGAEGLIRLFDDEKGFISPAYFIPLLEEHNAIYMIDLFILRQAFLFQAHARKEGLELVPISVNFSKNTLMYKDLMEHIKFLCDKYGMPEGMITIEITETISNMDHLEVNRIAKDLHNIGFSISMDDFGTKYSNMSVLTQFDFDTVKIDRSMILDIVENKKNQKVLKHMLSMFKDLGLESVIEGVETAEQVEVLKELGCDTIQGFFFGRPEPEEKFYELYM